MKADQRAADISAMRRTIEQKARVLEELRSRQHAIDRAMKAADWDLAVALLEDMPAKVPPSSVSASWQMLGQARFRAGDVAGADEALEQALVTAQDPLSTARAFRLRCGFSILSGRLAEALARCEQGLASFPQSPELWLLKAEILREDGQLVEAIGCLDRALEMGGDERQDAEARCMVLADLEEPDAALVSLERSSRGQLPDDASSLPRTTYVMARLSRPGAEHLVRALHAVAPESRILQQILDFPRPAGGTWRDEVAQADEA